MRLAFIEAVRELNRSMNAWDLVSMNVDPQSPNVADAWTEQQLQVAEKVARAWVGLVARRREYDAVLRARPTH
jgi:hypothetical protein